MGSVAAASMADAELRSAPTPNPSLAGRGIDLLVLEPHERAAAGLVLGFQYPVEIPGVAAMQFIRESLNAQRRARGEQELSGAEFIRLARAEAAELGMDVEMLKRPVNVGFSGGDKKRAEMVQMGIMRPRFSPYDGQLYVAGLKGWQTNAARDGAIQRVRFTGKSATLPVSLGVTDAGITIGFSGPLDAASASDLQNFALEQNNVRWSSDYGSPELKLGVTDAKDPKGHGTTPVAIKSVKLSADRRTLFL